MTSEHQVKRIKIYKKNVEKLQAWRDVELIDAFDADYIEVFKSLLLERRGKGAHELWILLRKAATATREKKNFDEERGKILKMVRTGEDCFDLNIEKLEDESLDYAHHFSVANKDFENGLLEEFRNEIHQHIEETRGGNTNLGQVSNRQSWMLNFNHDQFLRHCLLLIEFIYECS